MTDEQFEKEKQRLRRFVDRWYSVLGLESFHTIFEYHRGLIPDYLSSTGTCSVNWEYHQAWVDFSCEKSSRLDDRDAELVVVHELCHILVNQMRDYTDEHGNTHIKHEESVVTQLSKAFLWVRESGEGKRDERGVRINTEEAVPA